jgi:hypothetical protein
VVAFLRARASVKESFVLDYDLLTELGACRDVDFFLFSVYSIDGFFAA